VATAIVFAAWTPRIPAVKDRLELNDGTLGLTLLGAVVGSVAAMLLVGGWVARWGSRRAWAPGRSAVGRPPDQGPM
jgi:hypothetical protein